MPLGLRITSWNNWRKLDEHGEFCWLCFTMENKQSCLQLSMALFGYGIVFTTYFKSDMV